MWNITLIRATNLYNSVGRRLSHRLISFEPVDVVEVIIREVRTKAWLWKEWKKFPQRFSISCIENRQHATWC